MFKNLLVFLISAKKTILSFLFSYCFVSIPKVISGVKLNISKTKFISILVSIFMIPASLAFATIDIAPLRDEFGAPVTSVSGGVDLLMELVRWLYTIIFVIAVLFILLSAYNFITSSGDTTKVEKAKSQLLYAVIGIAVALVSFTLVWLINDFLFNVSAPTPTPTTAPTPTPIPTTPIPSYPPSTSGPI